MEDQVISPRGPFTDVYLKFTELINQVQVKEGESSIRVPEKTIRCIWNDQWFKSQDLRTTDGERLEILFPGYWNFGPGPDFKSATIRVEGKTFEGDVEIHVYCTDWKAHSHSHNPDYNKVVLHVFLWKTRGRQPPPASATRIPAPRLPGAHIFELELKDYLKKGILELNDELDFDNYPVLHSFNYGRCHQPLARLSSKKLETLLNAAGDARVFKKMERYHDRILLNGYEQTLYEGVAEALGYPANKQPFQTLAESLPLNILQKIFRPRAQPADPGLRIQAWLFGMAGLAEFSSLETAALEDADRSYFEALQACWQSDRAHLPPPRLRARDWQFGGIRPANHPYRRIAGLAHLIVRHRKTGMFSDFIHKTQKIIAQSGNKGYTIKGSTKLYNYFCVEAADYWRTHYSPGGRRLAQAQQLIGPARSREIFINILLPMGLIYARACKSVALESALSLLFQSGKKTSDNKLLRFMKHYIFGNDPDMLKVLHSDKQTQGLIQVYQDFCTQNENNCLRCPFPDIVRRYFS